MPMLKYYLTALAVMSLVAFVLYGLDKAKAKAGKWRIKEVTLLGIGLLGGAVGALLGMYCFRHKTKHWYFRVVNWLGLLLQIGIGIAILYFR